jgi:hypothetical protein
MVSSVETAINADPRYISLFLYPCDARQEPVQFVGRFLQ